MAVGPLIRAALRAGVRYGPIVYGVVKKNREPAQAAYDRTTARVEARRIARQAAESTSNGSVLRVIRDGEPRWVVFSGDEPVDVYPRREGDNLADLVRYADLTQRQAPSEMGASAAIRSTGGAAVQKGTDAAQAAIRRLRRTGEAGE